MDYGETQMNDAGHGEARGRREMSVVLYAFSYGVNFELEGVRQCSVPTHRLWGAVELGKLGWRVGLSPEPSRWWRRMGATGWRVWQTLWLLKEERRAAAIVAVHEISALLLLVVRALGWQGAPLVVLDLGLLHPKNCSGPKLWIWRWALRKADRVISLVDANRSEMSRIFGVKEDCISFLPMAVDVDFSGRAVAGLEGDYVLAVGTNDGKDFETLLEALPLGVRLIVVTDSYNARKVRAHCCFGGLVEVKEAVPARDLRELYLRAAVVVVPLADTPHGSGHTVLLETMAMGKIVVVSRARCMWDYIGDGQTVLSVPVGDVEALRGALEESLQHPERFTEMRERAAAQVRSSFDIRRFGQGLDRIIGELTAGQGSCALEQCGSSSSERKEGDKSYASVS